ncbi:MAG: membrane dipeptidase, partial [Candidatus Gallimonas sp.]
MRYCDLHCDALTTRNAPQVTRENLRRGGCLLQCFAAFSSARENAYGETLALAEQFSALCGREGYHVVLRPADLDLQKTNALLTVEGGGGIGEGEKEEERLEELYARGVRMFGLVWNYPNGLAYPNFPDYDGLSTGRSSFSARERRGLTKRGRRAAEKALSLGMMLDVSHAS